MASRSVGRSLDVTTIPHNTSGTETRGPKYIAGRMAWINPRTTQGHRITPGSDRCRCRVPARARRRCSGIASSSTPHLDRRRPAPRHRPATGAHRRTQPRRQSPGSPPVLAGRLCRRNRRRPQSPRIDQPVDWLGNAWVAPFGILFAAAQPDRCRTLTAIGPPVYPLSAVERRQIELLSALYRVADRCGRCSIRWWTRCSDRRPGPKTLKAPHSWRTHSGAPTGAGCTRRSGGSASLGRT